MFHRNIFGRFQNCWLKKWKKSSDFGARIVFYWYSVKKRVCVDSTTSLPEIKLYLRSLERITLAYTFYIDLIQIPLQDRLACVDFVVHCLCSLHLRLSNDSLHNGSICFNCGSRLQQLGIIFSCFTHCTDYANDSFINESYFNPLQLKRISWLLSLHENYWTAQCEKHALNWRIRKYWTI